MENAAAMKKVSCVKITGRHKALEYMRADALISLVVWLQAYLRAPVAVQIGGAEEAGGQKGSKL